MAKPRIIQTTLYDSPRILVFWCQRSQRNSNPQRWRQMEVG